MLAKREESGANVKRKDCRLFGGGRVLGDSLRSLGNGVLGELAGKDEADRGLDLTRGDGRLLVVSGKLGGLGRNTLEDVVDERVQDRHGTVGDTGVRVNLLEDLVDVGGVRLLSGLGALLLFTRGSGLLGVLLLGGGLWGSLAGGGGLLLGSLGRHFESVGEVGWLGLEGEERRGKVV